MIIIIIYNWGENKGLLEMYEYLILNILFFVIIKIICNLKKLFLGNVNC